MDGRNAVKRAWHRYQLQKTRGSQGYGFVDVVNKKVGRGEIESEIKLELDKINTTELLFHHRFPTSTPNLVEATHPIVVKGRGFKNVLYVVHNGVISNDDELKEAHGKLGIKYTTEITKQIVWKSRQGTRKITGETVYNDSEAFAVDLALYLNGKQDKIKSEGSIAFIALETDKLGNPLKLYYGRNHQNPLVVEKKREFVAIKSSGEGEQIEAHKLYTYNYATDKTEIKDCNIGPAYIVRTYDFSSGAYGHVGSGAYGTNRTFGFQSVAQQTEDEKQSDSLEEAYAELEEIELKLEDLRTERQIVKYHTPDDTAELARIDKEIDDLDMKRYDLEITITYLLPLDDDAVKP